MSSNQKSTPLYNQVEEALKDFSAGVEKFKFQQKQTNSMLARGQAAVDRLDQEFSRINQLKEDVGQGIEKMEQFQSSFDSECQTLAKAIEDTRESALHKIDFRRQELMEIIQNNQARTDTHLTQLKNRDKRRQAEFAQELMQIQQAIIEARRQYQALATIQENTTMAINERLDQIEGTLSLRTRLLVLGIIVTGIIGLVGLLSFVL